MLNHANLTRHLGTYQRTSAGSDRYADRFFAIAGAANITLESTAGDLPVSIRVNGKALEVRLASAELTTLPVTVDAGNDNRIEITLSGDSTAAARVRVTQHAELDFQFTGYVTYAGNTLNFRRSLDFYAKLGWTTKLGGFPKTNTREMGQALGVDGPYRVSDGSRSSRIRMARSFSSCRYPANPSQNPATRPRTRRVQPPI